MIKNVEYCENSTITEAWAVVQGGPGKVQDSEFGALENYASKKIGKFETKPSFVLVKHKGSDETVPAFWKKQLSWDNEKYLARIGHRYLSVHFVKQGEGKYEQYNKSLKPQVEGWLDSYKETVSGLQEQYPIENISFGYINLFKLPVKDFDLSRYFKVNFGTGVSYANNGIGALEIVFSVHEPETRISVRVTPDPSDSEIIIVTTRVEARKLVEESFSFEDSEQILELIGEMKEAAKSVFFDLATNKTHDIMGAKYA